jgi:DNA-binding XRE family transcriptional regulator
MTRRHGADPVGGRSWSLCESTRSAQRWSAVIDGHELQRLRRQAGLSQAQLADQAEVGISTVARLERQCRGRCRAWTLARIATALGLPQDALRLSPSADIAHAQTPAASELARIRYRFPLWAVWSDSEGLAAVRGSTIVRRTSLGDLEEWLATYENQRSRPGALEREYPDWQIEINPGGIEICTAFWCSPDGRSRRVVIARSSGDLLGRLRAIAPVANGSRK